MEGVGVLVDVNTPTVVKVHSKRCQNLRLQRLNSELLNAVALGDVQEVLRLLAHGASVNATCAPTHCAAVHVAALFGHLSVLGILVERGAAVGCLDCCHRSPLHLAAWTGSRECLLFLLERCSESVGAKVVAEKQECEAIARQLQDSRLHDHEALRSKLPALEPGSTPLHVASQMANVECIQCLLDAGADHTATDEAGLTPLDVVGEKLVSVRSEEGEVEYQDDSQHKRFPRAIQILISAGAKIMKSSLKKNSRKTLLRTAVELRSLDAIRLLVTSFGTLFWEKTGDTPLHVAVARRLEEPLKVILEACRNADRVVVDECNAQGLTALHAAVTDQWWTGVNILLEGGASLLAKTPTDATVLHFAAATGNAEILVELLKVLELEEQGLQILDATNNAGETPLYCAVNSGNIACVSLLLNANADVSKKSASEFTVLHRAAEYNHPEILDLLLRQVSGPLIEAMDTARMSGVTPLLMAAGKGFAGCVQVLLHHGCNVRARVKESKDTRYECTGETALHLASAAGHAPVVKMLLRHDHSLVNERDVRGRMAIHEACRSGHRECAQFLLASCADLSARCKDDDDNDITAMELLMHNIARPVNFLEKALDSSITINDKTINDSDIVVTMDYSMLNGGGQDSNQLKVIDSLTQTGNRFGQQTLLLHPLIESFLFLKWKKMSPYFYALIALYSVFVVTFSILCITTHYFQDTNTPVPSGLDESACRYIVVTMVILLALIELVHILQMPLLYLRDSESWLKMTSFALSLVVTFTCENADNEQWLRHVTTLAILITWMQYLYLISRVPHIGYYILMFSRVTINVVFVLMTFLFLIVGFAISFMIQFKANPPFNTPWEALIKTFMMMTGDFDYQGLFGEDEDLAASPVLGRIIFLVFVVLVGIALMNLLVGMAVNDITGLEVKGNISRLRKQAEFLSLLESMVFSDVLLNVLPKALRDKLNKYRKISAKVELYPGKPRKAVTKIFPNSLKEKILLRVMQNRVKITGDPTLQDIYSQINSLSNSVDIMSGARIKLSDHIDSTESINRYDATDGKVDGRVFEDMMTRLDRIRLTFQQIAMQDQHTSVQK